MKNLILCWVGFVGLVDASTNFALHKPATSSSFLDSNASNAVDGKDKSVWKKRTCFQTNSTDLTPWLMIDLQGYYKVETLVVTPRTDSCCLNRLHDFSVEVYPSYPGTPPSPVGPECLYYVGSIQTPESYSLPCTAVHSGRYVVLRGNASVTRNNAFTVCEVEIYEEPDMDKSVNLALNKSAYASTVRDNEQLNVIDGNPYYTCFLSEDDRPAPWWMVDLEGYYEIAIIVVTDKAGKGANYLHNFLVEVYDSRPETPTNQTGLLCLSYSGTFEPRGARVALPCSKVYFGRYVLIRGDRTGTETRAQNRMSICEVEIYETPSVSGKIAQNKSASSNIGNVEASYAVDGSSKCFVTNSSSPWLMIDLEGLYAIEKIVISTCCGGLGDFFIESFKNNPGSPPQSKGDICMYHPGNITSIAAVILVCPAIHNGRYLLLKGNGTRHNDVPFTICEINIVGRLLFRECVRYDRQSGLRGMAIDKAISNATVSTVLDCANHCYRKNGCNSFNFNGDEPQPCELISNTFAQLASDPNWTNFKIVSC